MQNKAYRTCTSACGLETNSNLPSKHLQELHVQVRSVPFTYQILFSQKSHGSFKKSKVFEIASTTTPLLLEKISFSIYLSFQISASSHCSTAECFFIPLHTCRSETQLHCASERAKTRLYDEKYFSFCSCNQTGLGSHFICAHFLNENSCHY